MRKQYVSYTGYGRSVHSVRTEYKDIIVGPYLRRTDTVLTTCIYCTLYSGTDCIHTVLLITYLYIGLLFILIRQVGSARGGRTNAGNSNTLIQHHLSLFCW